MFIEKHCDFFFITWFFVNSSFIHIIKDSKSVLNTKYFPMLDEHLLLCCLNLSVCNFF